MSQVKRTAMIGLAIYILICSLTIGFFFGIEAGSISLVAMFWSSIAGILVGEVQ